MKRKRCMALLLAAAMTVTMIPVETTGAAELVDESMLVADEIIGEELLEEPKAEPVEEPETESEQVMPDEQTENRTEAQTESQTEAQTEGQTDEVSAVVDEIVEDDFVIESIEVEPDEIFISEEDSESIVERQFFSDGEGTSDYGTEIASGDCGATEEDNLKWTVYDSDGDGLGNTLVISGEGAMEDFGVYSVIIPRPWNSYENENFTKIILENGITHIGNYAFWYCRSFTEDLIVPDSVTSIGEHAFENCSGFTGNLIIPDSVTSIGDYAFSGCGFTGNLIIPDSATSIGSGVFSGCSGFTGNLIIPDSVTSIGSRVFSGCSGFTGQLTIPDSVTSIGYGAFGGCSGFTGDLIIPDSVTSLGGYAFSGCSGFNGKLKISNNVAELDYTFRGCSGFTGDLIIPDSVMYIRADNSDAGDGGDVGAFTNCSGFNGKLVLPEGVKEIGDDAFKGCSGLTGDLTIPDSVTSIGNSAFSGCSGFTGDLIIPDSVTSIGNGTFRGCNGFTGNLIIADSVTSIGGSAFSGCSGFTGDLIIPDSVTSLGEYAFGNCSGFDGKLKISNNVTTLVSTFEGCSGFTGDLIIPDSVTVIRASDGPGGAFAGCSGFDGKLVLPTGITEIGYDAFSGCSGLTGQLVIPDSVTCIRGNAFKKCSGFTGNLIIPDSVTWIEYDAFYGCSGFTGDLIIPDSVTQLDGSAFKNCTGLNGKLVLSSNLTSIQSDTFSGCRRLTGELVIPDSVTSIGANAFYKCSGFTGELEIPESVTHIGDSAFFSCLGLTGTLTLPQKLEILEEDAFYLTSFDKIVCRGKDSDIYYSEKTLPDSAGIYGYEDSTAQEYAELFGRNFVADHYYETTVIKEAVCGSEGKVKHTCIICGDEYEESVSATDHKWNATATVDKAPTCTATGTQSIHCSICGAVKPGSQTTIAMTAHAWGDWKQTIAPTAKAEGQEQRVCSVCGKTETRSLAKTALNLTKVQINKPTVVSGDHIQITWGAVADADGYAVYRSTGGSWKKIATLKGNVLTYTDTSTKIGTTYSYSVRAYAAEGGTTKYSPSNKPGVSIKQTFYKAAVKMKSATALSSKSIKIKWTGRKKSTGYIIYRRIPGKSWTKLATVGKTTTYTDKTCKAATTYQYAVKAYTKVGSKYIYSKRETVGAVAVTKMVKPNLTVKSTKKRTATLKWTKQSNVSGYVIYRKESGGKWEKIKRVSAKTSTYTDKKLTSKKTYYYIVKAYKKAIPSVGLDEPVYSPYSKKKVKVK